MPRERRARLPLASATVSRRLSATRETTVRSASSPSRYSAADASSALEFRVITCTVIAPPSMAVSAGGMWPDLAMAEESTRRFSTVTASALPAATTPCSMRAAALWVKEVTFTAMPAAVLVGSLVICTLPKPGMTAMVELL